MKREKPTTKLDAGIRYRRNSTAIHIISLRNISAQKKITNYNYKHLDTLKLNQRNASGTPTSPFQFVSVPIQKRPEELIMPKEKPLKNHKAMQAITQRPERAKMLVIPPRILPRNPRPCSHLCLPLPRCCARSSCCSRSRSLSGQACNRGAAGCSRGDRGVGSGAIVLVFAASSSAAAAANAA